MSFCASVKLPATCFFAHTAVVVMTAAGAQQPPLPRQQSTAVPEPQEGYASGTEGDYSDSEDEGTEGYKKGVCLGASVSRHELSFIQPLCRMR